MSAPYARSARVAWKVQLAEERDIIIDYGEPQLSARAEVTLRRNLQNSRTRNRLALRGSAVVLRMRPIGPVEVQPITSPYGA